MHSVSPYPNTVLAAWQLALIAVVAVAGVAFWLAAVYLAAREPRDHAVASQTPSGELSPAAEPEPERPVAAA